MPENVIFGTGPLGLAVANTLMNGRAHNWQSARNDRPRIRFLRAYARQSKAADGLFARALSGKAAQVLGDTDAPHTYSFIDEFASGLVTLALHDEALGEVLHIPNAETVGTRRFVELVFSQLQNLAGSNAHRPWRSRCQGWASRRWRR